MTDSEFLEALDLLDQLVDGNIDTVTKARVVTWKAVVRGRIVKDQSKLPVTLDDAAAVVGTSLMDQQGWVPTMDINPAQALILAHGVLRDLAPVFEQVSGVACPLDHHMCPRAWTKEDSQ